MSGSHHRNRKGRFVPRYSVLNAIAPAAPSQLLNWEASDHYTAKCEERTRELLAVTSKHAVEENFFYSASLPEQQGIITVQSRQGRPVPCAMFFSSDIRRNVAADILFGTLKLEPIQLTAAEFVDALRALESVGIKHFVLDRCPRSWSFPVTESGSIKTVDNALTHWSFVKAIELTRGDYYASFAENLFASGDIIGARDVALFAVAHVTPEDQRFHNLLAQIGEHTNDKVLETEAREAAEQTVVPFRTGDSPRGFRWRPFDSALKI